MAKDPVDKLTHALCGLGRPFEIFNSKRKLFYYHLVTPQCRTHGVILLCAQRTTMPHSPPSDRCDQLIFRGNIGIIFNTCKKSIVSLLTVSLHRIVQHNKYLHCFLFNWILFSALLASIRRPGGRWPPNHRPRKSLGYLMPLEYFKKLYNFDFGSRCTSI